MYARRQATVAEVEAAARDHAAKLVGLNMTVAPNVYGVRVECNVCHDSWTHNNAWNVTMLASHAAGHGMR